MKPAELFKLIDSSYTHMTKDADGEVWIWSFKPIKNRSHWFKDNNTKTRKSLRIYDRVPEWLGVDFPKNKSWEDCIVLRRN